MIRTIGESGINWNWYLCADFNEADRTAHIYYNERWHKYENSGSKHPKAEWIKDDVTMLEDDNRIVYGVKIGKVEYLVTNPKKIFDYHDMSVYVSE